MLNDTPETSENERSVTFFTKVWTLTRKDLVERVIFFYDFYLLFVFDVIFCMIAGLG
jgi:hypothetical protein